MTNMDDSDDLVTNEENNDQNGQSFEENNDEIDVDNEESEDDETEDEDEENVCMTMDKPPRSPNSVPTCYICLNEFEGQDIGSPENCEKIHFFCLECIEEWSKRVNTCPVDRKAFSSILVRKELDGDVIMKLPLLKQSVIEIETMSEDVTFCEICGRCDREDRLMLCDGCDFGYHMECLDPPLETVPVEEWFCPECFERLFGEDAHQTVTRSRAAVSSGQSRAIARTGTFEIVRSRILARRIDNNTSRTTRSRKRQTKRPQKAARRKKRTHKSRQSTKRLPPSCRKRIASVLGLCNFPKSPFGLPDVRLAANSSCGGRSSAPSSSGSARSEKKSASNIRGLSMFGQEIDFYDPRSYEEAFEFEGSGGGGGGGGTVGLVSRQSMPRVSKGMPSIIAPLPSQHLLSEILTSQEMLHATASDLDVARDGRVYVNSNKNKQFAPKRCADSNSNNSAGSSGSSSSSQNSESSSKDGGNNRIGNGKTSSFNAQTNAGASGGQNGSEDISLIKPLPQAIVNIRDDKMDMELYSDIESLTGDKDEEDKNADNQNAKKVDQAQNSDNVRNSKEKRIPTVADLFGEDTDDEDGVEDLKKLVQRQGSINIHYPIRMDIKLKTDKLDDAGGATMRAMENDVPIMKKWVPLYPEQNKPSTSNGPKWKVVGQDEDGEKNKKKKVVNIPELKQEKEEIILDEVDGHSMKTDESHDKSDTEEVFPEISMKLSKEEESYSFLESNVKVCKHGKVHKKSSSKKSESHRRSSSIDSLLERSSSEGSFQLVKEIKTDTISLEKQQKKVSPEREREDETTRRRGREIEREEARRNDDRHTRRHDDRESDRRKSDRERREVDDRRSKYYSEHDDRGGRDRSTRHRDDSRAIDDKRARKHSRERSHSPRRPRLPRTPPRDDSRTRTKMEHDDHRTRRGKRKDSRHRSPSKSRHSSKHCHHHRHRHHSIHRSPKTPPAEDDKKIIEPGYLGHPVIDSVDSKKVYQDGDNIKISVNFRREPSPELKVDSKKRPRTETKDEDAKSKRKAVNGTKRTSESSTAPGTSGKAQELKFLPKMQNETDFDQKTPEDKVGRSNDSNDSYDAPTPTQDELQSPLRLKKARDNASKDTLKINKPETKKPTKTISTLKDDFYDSDLFDLSPDKPPSKKITKDKTDSKNSKDLPGSSLISAGSNAKSSSSMASNLASCFEGFDIDQIIAIAHELNNQQISNRLAKSTASSTVATNVPASSVPRTQAAEKEPERDDTEAVDMDLDSPNANDNNNNANQTPKNPISQVMDIWGDLLNRTKSKTDPGGDDQAGGSSGTGNGMINKSFDDKVNKEGGDLPITASQPEMDKNTARILKLNRQERIVEEVKLVIKPYFNHKKIDKSEYKEILKKSVVKVSHNKTGEINPIKIRTLVEAYVAKVIHRRKKSSAANTVALGGGGNNANSNTTSES